MKTSILHMVFGALVVLSGQFCWLAKHNFFLVHKTAAAEREFWDEVYSGIAVNPFDEFEGMEEGAWQQ